MMWDVVANAWVALVRADSVLATVLAPTATETGVTLHVYPAQAARPVRIPSVEYSFVSDTHDETFNSLIMQVDYWALNDAQARVIERRLRRITHRDTARTLGGHRMWTQYIDARSHQYTAKLGVVHRSLDFEMTPLREQYA